MLALSLAPTVEARENQKPERFKARPSCIAELRKDVQERRAATWKWQQAVGHTRTPTAWHDKTAISCKYLRWNKRRWALRADKAWRYYASLDGVEEAICHVFGADCSAALTVSWCESRHSVNAHNGQYLGLFQMGSWERRTFGHGYTPLAQAEAAHRYFVTSGRDWSPWSCKPWS